MGTLSKFVTTINTYGVRSQNLFAMKLTFPTSTMRAMHNFNDTTRVNWGRLSGELNKSLFAYGHGFTIPDRTINYADVSFQGYGVPIPTTMQFGTTHEMTFNDDLSGSLRGILLLWQNATINGNVTDGNFEGNRFTGDPSASYGANLKIYLMSNEYDPDAIRATPFGNPHIGYELRGVTVARVGDTTLSNIDSAIATIPVTLRSQYWELFQFDPSEVSELVGRS